MKYFLKENVTYQMLREIGFNVLRESSLITGAVHEENDIYIPLFKGTSFEYRRIMREKMGERISKKRIKFMMDLGYIEIVKK